MKRIIITLIIAIVLGSLLGGLAVAGNITYNPSQWQQPRTIQQGLNGTYYGQIQVKSEYFLNHEGTCWQLLKTTWTVTYFVTYQWGVKTDSGNQESERTTEVLVEFGCR